jgi:alkanesulfonate monooxygenase SsuD/methylene tetrahydromethanopterin reductase-like flavin-dependent oxidoreductase (luciferase family)
MFELAIRYDLRSPAFATPHSVLYPTAVEQAVWADRLGFTTIYLAEHHGADDGYLPAPFIVAGAMASRTTSIRFHFSAIIATVHNPVQLAEELAVLDNLSGGRVEATFGIGYRPHEFALFGVDKKRRVAMLEETIDLCRKAWSGQPVTFNGVTLDQVRPSPVQLGGPPIYIGGSAEPSAHRAAAIGDGYRPALPALYEVYIADVLSRGLPAPPPLLNQAPLFLYVSEDPDRDWERIAPNVLYATNATATWAKERSVGDTPYKEADNIDDLKSNPSFQVLTPEQCVSFAQNLGDDAELIIHPLFGGLDPELSWRSLELFESKVMPGLREVGLISTPISGETADSSTASK